MPPRQRTGSIARARLVEQIEAASHKPMTLIVAPAGSGKSTAAIQWAEETSRAVAWFGISESDNDPTAFFSAFAEAIRRLVPAQVLSEEQFNELYETRGALAAVASLLNDLAAADVPLTIVLDDYHVITNADIDALMSFVVANLPARMSVIMLSRAEPHLPLARLRARDELAEIGPRELRFTDDEAKEFLINLSGLNLDDASVRLLCQRSEGWAAGLQLAVLSMKRTPNVDLQRFANAFSGEDRLVGSYLFEELINRLPADERTFLEITSIADAFTPELCDALRESTDSAQRLEAIERQGLFLVALDDSGRLFRYHHLFADALRASLARRVSAEQVRRLHATASTWFERNGRAEDAFRHTVAAEDWPRAVNFLTPLVDRLVRENHLATLIRWVGILPESVLATTPPITFWYAYALIRTVQMTAAAKPIQWLREIDAREPLPGLRVRIDLLESLLDFTTNGRFTSTVVLETLIDHPEDNDAILASVASLWQAAHDDATGDGATATRRLAEVIQRSEELNAPWIRFEAEVLRGRIAARAGRLSEAVVMLSNALERHESTGSPQVPTALHWLSTAHLEWGNIDKAIAYAEQARDYAIEHQLLGSLPFSHQFLAFALAAKGEYMAAFVENERARDIGEEAGILVVGQIADALSALILRFLGDTETARSWADAVAQTDLSTMTEATVIEQLVRARILAADGDTDEALIILDTLRAMAVRHGRGLDVLRIDVQIALTHHTAGDAAKALELFERALAAGEPENIFMSFVRDGAPSLSLLRKISRAGGPHARYAGQIMTKFDQLDLRRDKSEEDDVDDSLSRREAAVLRLMADGMTNRQIADHLYVTEWTIKKHATHIMRKLGTENRVQAIETARSRGLLLAERPASTPRRRRSEV